MSSSPGGDAVSFPLPFLSVVKLVVCNMPLLSSHGKKQALRTFSDVSPLEQFNIHTVSQENPTFQKAV